MAVYKVPQDVEAEDKLLGPFSFRQFIYLVVAILAGGLAYFLGTIFIGLAVIPLPVALVFLVLALPLRKDQPMEVYAAAILAFYLKPRRKLWDPDGILTMVEFTNDITKDDTAPVDISFAEARQQISYLSNLVDSNGQIAQPNTVFSPSLQSDIVAEARQVEDIHDDDADINQRFDHMINRHNQEMREQIIENLSGQNTTPTQVAEPTPTTSPQEFYIPPPPPVDPFYAQSTQAPSAIPQPVITESPDFPTGTPQNPQNSYDFSPSPDIINLANNSDLSVQTIATEAKKIADRKKSLLGDEDEVVISLR